MPVRKIPAPAPLAAALAFALASPVHAFEAAATDLDAVEVQGVHEKRPVSPKFTQPLLDTPQSVTIVPAELMREQGVTSLRDALRNVPGISMQAGEGGVPAGDNLTLRGFSARTDLFIDGIRDFGGYSRDPFNLEQIEVVKGPSSTHSGRGSTGGSINLASKTARAGNFNDIGVSADDGGMARVTADFNRELGQTSAFRVNLMGHHGGINGRDHVENQRFGVAPTLSFGLGTDTTTTVSLFHLEQDNVPDYGQPWVPGTNNALPESRNRTAPVDRSTWYGILERDYENTRTDLATVTVQHAFGDTVNLENITRWGASYRDSVITAPRFTADPGSTDITRAAPKTRDSRDGILTNVTNLRADLTTGSIEHALLVGLELAHEKSRNHARMEDTSAGTTPLTDLFNPDPHGAFAPLARDTHNDARAEADSAAIYVFDTVTFNPRWELSGGLRWDRFETEALTQGVTYGRTDTELNGRIGLVFKPVENGSIYAALGTSFNPSAEGMSLNAALADVAPEESRTGELGTKWDLLGGRLSLTSAIFRTEKTNVRIDVDPTASTTYALDGKQRVDGFEVGAAGRITRDWTVNFGYAFLDSEILSNRALPAEVGNEMPNTPRHSANLWTSYRINDSFDVGFGVQHVGSRWTSTANERLAKSYTTYDAMVGYRINEAVGLRLNAYNLSNKEYVDRVGGGHYIPGAERTVMLSADFSF
ncbi:TonB-dependent receptor [Agrilutibacter solisilvae]|uniref:TonB-dependent siderophore receptor n=1 Tax=Agrilutibacter solisilvae TaxID=2763317 RepID=A0A974XYZ2_9GAMM|nr:TonB-dependent siderophore receptor [Lysobacter solisilvae]QSX78372.1 TonB-dependent siderophore receptor [Lysobacter solisilvae]